MRVNTHIHLPPNFSAFDNVEQAVSLAVAEGIDALGASNYYDHSVYREFADAAGRSGIFPLFGIEIVALLEDLQRDGIKINDPGNPGKMYICGKGIGRFDPMRAEAQSLLAVIRRNDSERMAAMTARLVELFGRAGLRLEIDESSVKQSIALRHSCPLETVYLQERHICQAIQEALFASIPESGRSGFLERLYGLAPKANSGDGVGVQNEIRTHLMKAGKPAYVDETFVGFDHAYRLILALGGIPCYPTLADGANPICGFENDVEGLISEVKRRGIWAAEFIPIRNSPDTLRRYVLAMREAGLIITVGTEHNTLDLIPILPTCVSGQPIPADIVEIFNEGACVVAAHQARVMKGETGYLDGAGRLNPEFASAEQRIRTFRDEGKALIEARVAASSGSSA